MINDNLPLALTSRVALLRRLAPVLAVSALLITLSIVLQSYGPSLMPGAARKDASAGSPSRVAANADLAAVKNDLAEQNRQTRAYAVAQSAAASTAIGEIRSDVSAITADVAAIRASVKTLETQAVVIGGTIASLPAITPPEPPKPRSTSPRVFRAAGKPAPAPVVFLPSGPPVVIKTAAELQADEHAATQRLREWQRQQWQAAQLATTANH